jgi:hypothetical protein
VPLALPVNSAISVGAEFRTGKACGAHIELVGQAFSGSCDPEAWKSKMPASSEAGIPGMFGCGFGALM